jgi:hypothetical protein
MNMNLSIKPVDEQNLELDKLRRLINLPLWNRFEAACYLLAKELLNFEEFQSTPPGYQETFNELLKDPSADPDLIREFQKFKTKYPDIEEMYNDLGKLPKPRIANIQTDSKTGIIISAEPMVWIKLAMENDLTVAPGIHETWIFFLHRPAKKHFLRLVEHKKSKCSHRKKINLKNRESANARPLHEPADIDNIQDLGRSIFRKNLDWSKQNIAEEICKTYPRAKCYTQFALVKWLSWANLARRDKGCHTNLVNKP